MGSDERAGWESDIKIIKASSKNKYIRFVWWDKNSALVQFFLYECREKTGK